MPIVVASFDVSKFGKYMKGQVPRISSSWVFFTGMEFLASRHIFPLKKKKKTRTKSVKEILFTCLQFEKKYFWTVPRSNEVKSVDL